MEKVEKNLHYLSLIQPKGGNLQYHNFDYMEKAVTTSSGAVTKFV
jgi:hypothetical protein